MEEGCEHTEASPIGKCAICGRAVCTDCYNEVFGAMICDQHPGLEDDSGWELVGIFTDATLVAQRRYDLEENGITALVVDSEEENIEVYVPHDEKDDAFATLAASADEEHSCPECQIQFAGDIENCPVCGEKPVGAGEENHSQD